jgi:hypothetical protein
VSAGETGPLQCFPPPQHSLSLPLCHSPNLSSFFPPPSPPPPPLCYRSHPRRWSRPIAASPHPFIFALRRARAPLCRPKDHIRASTGPRGLDSTRASNNCLFTSTRRPTDCAVAPSGTRGFAVLAPVLLPIDGFNFSTVISAAPFTLYFSVFIFSAPRGLQWLHGRQSLSSLRPLQSVLSCWSDL